MGEAQPLVAVMHSACVCVCMYRFVCECYNCKNNNK